MVTNNRFLKPLQHNFQIRDAQGDVIHRVSARADQFSGLLAWVDDQTNLAEADGRGWRTDHAERLAHRLLRIALRPGQREWEVGVKLRCGFAQ